jgi:hypothetical protein
MREKIIKGTLPPYIYVKDFISPMESGSDPLMEFPPMILREAVNTASMQQHSVKIIHHLLFDNTKYPGWTDIRRLTEY